MASRISSVPPSHHFTSFYPLNESVNSDVNFKFDFHWIKSTLKIWFCSIDLLLINFNQLFSIFSSFKLILVLQCSFCSLFQAWNFYFQFFDTPKGCLKKIDHSKIDLEIDYLSSSWIKNWSIKKIKCMRIARESVK